MTIYADTSFFVSLYVIDQHSLEARRRIETSTLLWLTPLHRSEWTHAIAQHVFRGVLSSSKAEGIYAELARDRDAGLWLETDLPAMAFETSIALARAHVARLGTRTLDTLHVACALELKAERFWTFDERQRKLAKAAGLKVS